MTQQSAPLQQLGYSPDQAAKILGFSRSMLYAEWSAGRGPKRIKVGRRTLVTEDGLRAYLADLQNSQRAA